jgi:hypothetical protein
MSKTAEEKELWVRFAVAAIGIYERPDDVEGPDDVPDDVAEMAAKTADALMDEYDERYLDEPARPTRRGRRKPDPDEEDE